MYRKSVNPFHADATFVHGKKIKAKRFDEYPCARVSVILKVFCIILYWPN